MLPTTQCDMSVMRSLIDSVFIPFLAYSVWKKNCSSPGCGLVCEGAGCLNYYETNEYTIELECTDAYGSSDTKNLTIVVNENESPVLTNLPGKSVIKKKK